VTGLQRAGVLSLGVAGGGYCFRSCPVSRLSLKSICRGVGMTVSRFVLVDFRYTSDPLGHIRLYEAGNTYDMPPALAHAAAKRDLVAAQRPVDWEPPSILRPPEVLTEAELAAAEAELKALQRHAFEVVDPESR
jgi:hypothetical protein